MKLWQLQVSCHSGRGEALLSFRRAPRGLALRRYRVRFHHATAVAQSYRGSFGLPASLASKSKRDALAAAPQLHIAIEPEPPASASSEEQALRIRCSGI